MSPQMGLNSLKAFLWLYKTSPTKSDSEITSAIKSRTIRWAGHVARVEENCMHRSGGNT